MREVREGERLSSHLRSADMLARFGATPVKARTVIDGNDTYRLFTATAYDITVRGMTLTHGREMLVQSINKGAVAGSSPM